jgi:hypothetical protein
MNLFSHPCPECGSEDVCADHQYKTKNVIAQPSKINTKSAKVRE